jgi:RND family efflux transporter MFP subunit
MPMAIGKDRAVARQLRTLFDVGAILELTDGQLLERFATGRGEAAELAFAVLLERHGPMVLRVCRGVLADVHDTQDAFQATFLVLVEKARGLWVRDSLGPWLHQVAFRTASCARSAAARRRRHEKCVAKPARESRVEAGDELGPILHAEIERLPERYRAPLVLCDIEGRSYEQVARHLGWPVGTVKSRLTRGRQRLRDRLQRRGLAPDAGLLAAVPGLGGPDRSLPAALVDSTTRAAVQWTTIGTNVPGSAALCAQGVLKTMSSIKCLKVASVVLILGATAAGVDLLALAQKVTSGAGPGPDPKLPAARVGDVPAATVKPGKLRVTVVAKGVVEASRSEFVTCQVEGSTTIIALVPEGTKVDKGQLVGELDSSDLKDSLKSQKPATLAAEAAYREAQSTRRVAEAAVVEFARAISRSEQEIKKLQAEVEKARSEELARQQAWEREKDKEAKLEKQIKNCTLLAPLDGIVVYGNDPDRPFRPPVIVVGAKVRERQIIFHVHDVDGPMRVNIKVPEAEADGIKRGLAARIHVDAFPGVMLTGKVESINPRPDTNRLFSPDITVYTARVTIDKGPPGLRPGMAAQVEVLVNEFDNVLTVTRFSVLHFDGKDHVAVKRPDGGFDWREVTLGVSNDTSVEVKQGLQSGEAVIQNPRRLLSAEEKRAKLGAPAPPADKPSIPR